MTGNLLPIPEEQILPRLLATTVLGVPETARERSLLAARQHHRTRIPMLPERIQECRSKPEIPGHKLAGILRPVHPREIEYKIRLGAPRVQFHRRTIDIVFEHFFDTASVMPDLIGHLEPIVPRLPVPDIFQLRAQVPAHETLRAGHQNLHITKISKISCFVLSFSLRNSGLPI